MQRERLGIRLGAWLIDLFCLQLLTAPLFLILAWDVVLATIYAFLVPFTGGRTLETAEKLAGRGIFTALLIAALMLAYWLTEVFLAASPGKLLLGLRIRSRQGSPASYPALAGRAMTKHLGLLLYVGVLVVMRENLREALWIPRLATFAVWLGALLALRYPYQAAHDRLWDTAVFRLPRRVSKAEEAELKDHG